MYHSYVRSHMGDTIDLSRVSMLQITLWHAGALGLIVIAMDDLTCSLFACIAVSCCFSVLILQGD